MIEGEKKAEKTPLEGHFHPDYTFNHTDKPLAEIKHSDLVNEQLWDSGNISFLQ